MGSTISKFTLRIDSDLLLKFRYVAKYDDRSVNGELHMLINKHIAAFEDVHGKIPDDCLEETTRNKR